MINSSGTLITLGLGDPNFTAVLCGLGYLGIITAGNVK
jgi:hypothetical protein